MVSSTHEASHRLFHDHPAALAPVFEALGLPPPSKEDFDALSPDATEVRPLERRVDTVLAYEPPMGENFLVAIEAQTKKDPDKARSWAYYVAFLQAKYDMPVLLVPVCRDRGTAAWATGPFACTAGPWTTQVTRPFVLGPQTVPLFTDASAVAQRPALAALAVIVHSDDRRVDAILETVARGFMSFTPNLTEFWLEVVEIGLEGRAEGEALGEAKGVLRVLEVRGIPVSDEARERISSCTDLDLVNDWLDRAGTVQRAEDLLTDA